MLIDSLHAALDQYCKLSKMDDFVTWISLIV